MHHFALALDIAQTPLKGGDSNECARQIPHKDKGDKFVSDTKSWGWKGWGWRNFCNRSYILNNYLDDNGTLALAVLVSIKCEAASPFIPSNSMSHHE